MSGHGPRGKPVWTDGTPPGAEEYVALRAACGLGGRSIKAAATGLPNSSYVTTCRDGARLIAMARMVGDEGAFMQLVDVMVAPAHQGTGLGREAVARALAWAKANLPATCLVGLHCAPGRESFYEGFAFRAMPGMIRSL